MNQQLIQLLSMDDRNFKLAEELVHPSYIRLAQNSINKREKIVKELLTQRQLPPEPLDEPTIRYILDTMALMDSNNFDGKVGVGERQSRVFSRIVAERHFHMGHGIGRSGDIMANQPKAAGSSLILQLTRYLTISALHQLNYQFVKDILPLPLATGMALTLSLLTLHETQPQKKYIIWSRIDQKTCLKSIITANLVPIVIQLKQDGDFLHTDLQAMQKKINEVGPDKILAVMSTTSCFAPRIPDKVDDISIIAKKYGIYHVVNNAYGIWCTKIAHLIKQGTNQGECTVVVQSTDKNFMVPVGGSFIFCKDSAMLEKISSKYPGRANGSPIVDLFITLLSMGKKTIAELKASRKALFQEFLKRGKDFAQKHNCRILQTPNNTISIGMYLNGLKSDKDITNLGSILYSKRVMGHRILAANQKNTIVGQNSFKNYGSHCDDYPYLPYITFACAVGTEREQILLFFDRLEESWKQLKKKLNKKAVNNKEHELEKKQIPRPKKSRDYTSQLKILEIKEKQEEKVESATSLTMEEKKIEKESKQQDKQEIVSQEK